MPVIRPLLTCVAMAAAFAAVPVHADPVSRPFKASLKTQEVIGFNFHACAAPPFLQGTTVGIGTASLLGRVELHATDCVNPGPTAFLFTNGRLVLTAANGDTVTADYSGTLTPSGSAAPSTLSGSFRVTGGTGRFSGATGSGYLTGSEQLLTGKGSYEVAGNLSY